MSHCLDHVTTASHLLCLLMCLPHQVYVCSPVCVHTALLPHLLSPCTHRSALYRSVPLCTALYCTVPYRTALSYAPSTPLCPPALSHVAPCYIVQSLTRDASGAVSAVTAQLHLEGDFKKTKLKLTWLADVDSLVPLRLVDHGFLITKKKVWSACAYQPSALPLVLLGSC